MNLDEKLALLRRKNRVTLFFPSTNPGRYMPKSVPLPNLGIGYIGTVLRHHGYDVHCVDANVLCPDISNDDHLHDEYVLNHSLNIIEETNPDVLGVGSWTVNFPFAAELIARFAERNPEKLIVLGGYQASFLPQFVLQLLPQIDILVRGEGENTMLELMDKLETGNRIDEVNGIAFRKGEEIVRTPDRDLIPNLDALPFIDYSIFVNFEPEKEPGLMVLTSRGCPYNCIFCSCKAFWRKIRTRSVGNIIEEIKQLRDRYKTNSFGVCDDLFTASKKKILDFCEMLHRENIHMDWNFNARIDTLDESIINLLLQNGASRIFCGLESININTLRFIGEKNPEEYLKTAFKLIELCLADAAPIKFSTIVGFPNETKKEIVTMLTIVRNLKSHGVAISTGLPICYPGTGLWNMYEKSQIRLTKIRDNRVRRNCSGMFSEKYEHLPECVPSAWMIENPHFDAESMEELIGDFYES